MSRHLLSSALVLSLCAAPLAAQVVLAVDNTIGATYEFTTTPGGPCFAPTPSATTCPYPPSVCPGVPPLTPLGFGTLLGDIADDPITDITYITDGRVISENIGDPACASPCVPIRTYLVPPTAPPMTAITGMGCSGTGSFGPAPVLWITDGTLVAGITPPVGCGLPTVVFPPCPAPTPLVPVTDVSWDPASGSLWLVSATGFAQGVTPGTCVPTTPLIGLAGCGLGLPLTGFAYDTSTPNFTGQPACAYVTDGGTVAYIDLTTGAVAPPTFATPVPCTPAPGFLSGLALAQRAVEYGSSRVTAKLSSFGQASTPGPTFGLEVSGAPAGATAWLVLNYNFPGIGFLCPALPGVGTKIWVSLAAPGTVTPLFPLPPGCVALPSAIPAAVPPGLVVFAQLVFLAGPPRAVDATNGIAVTIGLP